MFWYILDRVHFGSACCKREVHNLVKHRKKQNNPSIGYRWMNIYSKPTDKQMAIL